MTGSRFSPPEIALAVRAATQSLRAEHRPCNRGWCPWPAMTEEDAAELAAAILAHLALPTETSTHRD